ncbi:hypothetical protein A2999_01150 [Candidatus Wolfebacteria bacterium RIFCSPLOWO2_01_FULL_38_11]|uniref:SPW repeat-containing integral membrane domain-containing protein n=1 Tax=Candidatus Wolfebacteria bacterium RIFCSPLOWO2_01_FULL_38_11 TaxID=1802556 RepID=A0A1F8DR76_9BACT|nr:MAG: hypothetical protein A2999_01150 [Candidatus Wolfebacteria bacterium RIFCSPLOWO2_01_FULL_38_11]
MKWLNWVNLVLGVWIIISPWVLDFAPYTPALWSNLVAGILILVFALWQLFGSDMGSGSSGPTMTQ